jgi:hypothetical protein
MDRIPANACQTARLRDSEHRARKGAAIVGITERVSADFDVRDTRHFGHRAEEPAKRLPRLGVLFRSDSLLPAIAIQREHGDVGLRIDDAAERSADGAVAEIVGQVLIEVGRQVERQVI